MANRDWNHGLPPRHDASLANRGTCARRLLSCGLQVKRLYSSDRVYRPKARAGRARMPPPWFLVLLPVQGLPSLPGWMSKLCADRRVPFSRIRRGCHVLGRAKDPPAPGTRDEPRASRPGDVGSRPTEGDDEAVASQASHAGSPESLTRSGPPRQLPARCHAALVPILEGTVA